MITIQSRIHVARATGEQIFNFLINPTDREYQKWWPGTHLEFHTLRHGKHNIGNVIWMDERVGSYRVKMIGVVVEADPGRKIVWQMKKAIRLPVRLFLELEDDAAGVSVVHTIRAGFAGPGRVLDSLFRIFFSEQFEKAMDEHARIEFPRLGDMLLSEKSVA